MTIDLMYDSLLHTSITKYNLLTRDQINVSTSHLQNTASHYPCPPVV